MNSERLKVLEILSKGSISAEEAERLLTVLDEQEQAEKARSEEQRTAVERRESHPENDRIKGKKLRVDVKGNTAEAQNINVDVSVPLVLARYADDIIANLVPNEVDETLQKSGVNLKTINIGKIVDTLESLDEDIVNVDIDQDDAKFKVRVYVE